MQKKVEKLIEKEEKQKDKGESDDGVEKEQPTTAVTETKEEASSNNVDLLDFGGSAPAGEPQDKPKVEEEKTSEEVPQQPKKFGGLTAPPKNSRHVLNNVRSLNQKLQQQEPSAAASSEPAASKTDDANGDNLMNLLMGIDFNEGK